ncbi:uncharacterized protein DDB_G0287625-like [Argiope bruennichi]|uniref:uncharacterized protein DDB_G0287625-like n=1 Tax=Argiope bruennichi TaxID=94029 RepID=UPI002493E70F|nr:uncharacterized protein DDB_G0287625-like [Argiope bruennichi]
MDLNEIILKLPESQKRDLIEKLLYAFSLQNGGIDTASKDSAGNSSKDLKKSVNLSNSTPEKSLKQKTLDNWIVKSKTLSSNCEKELVKEAGESSRNVESEEGKKLEKSSKLDNAINKKKLMVLLNREDCPESVQKARGVIDEKLCDETNNSMASSAECKDNDKILKPIHKSATKQKQKLKTSLGKDISTNSNFVEMDYDQKTNSCNDKTSEDNIKNSECKTSPTLFQSESERTLVDGNKITVTDENPTIVDAVQKSSDNQESAVTELNENNKSAEYVPSKKVTKVSVINTDSTELTVGKTAQLPGTVVSASPSQEQITTNNIKSVSKLKLKKTIKSKVKSDMASYEKIKLDPAASKMKKKNLTSQEVNSDITINIDFQRISDEQLESEKNSETQIKVCTKETEKLLTKDIKSVTAINGDSKRISRKRGCENKRMVTTKNSSLSDQEPTSKNNDKDCTTSINFLSKMSPSQNKEFTKETNELLIKETNILTPINAKKMYKKKGKVSAKNSLISDSEQSSINNDEVSIISSETSSVDSLRNLTSQSKKFPKVTEESLIKGIDTVIQLDVSSKKIYRKKSNDNKSKISTKNNLISESEQSPKSNDMDSFTLETSSIDSSKNSLSRSKKFVKDTEESLIKDTPTETTLNIKSKKICRKKSCQNKIQISAKKSLVIDSEKTSKINEMDNITPSEASSQCKELAKATEELLSIETQIGANSKKRYRKKSNENRSKVVAETNLISNSEPASKNSDKDNIISTSTDSSNNSPSQNKKFSKETEALLIEDTTVTSKNNGRNNINSIETSLIDSSETSIPKDISTKQISSSDTEATISLSRDNYSKPINAFTLSDDHSIKNSKSLNSDSRNELNILNEMKETEEDLSKKSNAGSLNGPQTYDNIQESSEVSSVSKKVNTLKKKTVMQLPSNSKKKLKVIKDESSSNNLSIENENLCLKKNGSKKIVVSRKIKLGPDSNKEHSVVPIAKSMANSSHSNAVKEPNEHLFKNSKVNNKLGRTQKKTVRFQNSKKVKESHSKKENNLESQIMCNSNISKNGEMEELNCSLVNESSTKNKLHKGTNLSMIQTDNLEGEKENRDIIKNMEEETEKATDFIVNNSNNTDSAEINFKDPVECDEKMKHNYEAFCKVKEVLKVIGISIEELFENSEMINSLKSAPPDGVYFISKCKSDSKMSVHMHESKKELRNILNKLKRKYNDEAK